MHNAALTEMGSDPDKRKRAVLGTASPGHDFFLMLPDV
jgi:hypothetical protein